MRRAGARYPMKSRNLFFNLRCTLPTTSVEDFVTEGFCWILASTPAVSDMLIQLVLGKAGAEADSSHSSWFTQVPLSDSSSQRSRPDMICECSGIVLVFEHKIEEQVRESQLLTHRLLAQKWYSPRPVVIVLVTRDGDSRGGADVCMNWRGVQVMLQRFQPFTENSMLGQFVEFLGLEGLGRIPGPCPTYWKGNITEARSRHPAFPRGYVDLGRKFGDTILRTTLEDGGPDNDEDSEQDQRFFLQALEYAMSSNDPEVEVWRFCRRFFPSYLKYIDHRVGTGFQIPEVKGRRFAQGVIESIQEEPL